MMRARGPALAAPEEAGLAAAYPGDLLLHLRSFEAVAAAIARGERAVFARAAADLAVDVSVLRRRLQTLTEHVASPLLEGRGPALRLSRAGEAVHVHAERALEATSALAGAGRDERGPLRVACTGTIHAELLPPVLRQMREAFPALRFRVHRAGAEASKALLERGDIDFAVIRSASQPDGLSAALLGPDRLWLATQAAGPAARRHARARWTPEAIAREALIGYGPSSSTMRRVMEVLAPLGAAPWIAVDGKATALAYVAAGLGVAFVSALEPAVPAREGVAVRDVTEWFPPTSFWLVSRDGRRRRRRRERVDAPEPRWRPRFAELMREAAAGRGPPRPIDRKRRRVVY